MKEYITEELSMEKQERVKVNSEREGRQMSDKVGDGGRDLLARTNSCVVYEIQLVKCKCGWSVVVSEEKGIGKSLDRQMGTGRALSATLP